jgi:transposase
MIRTGAEWRMRPRAVPPWPAVSQQTRTWFTAGCFAALVPDRRLLMREIEGRAPHPTAAILAGRPLQARPESGGQAGVDGDQRRRGSTVHLAVETLGHLLAWVVTPAHEPERAQVGELAEQRQAATGGRLRGPGRHG